MSERFHVAARVEDVPKGGVLGVEVKGRPVALFERDGRIFALEDVCTHAGAKLSEGPVVGDCIVCPWHDAVFDIETGEPRGGPAFTPAQKLEVRVEGGEVLVELP